MRKEEIVQNLRSRIIAGEFSSQGALPLRHFLLEHYDASNMTVQRAINQLTGEGFLFSRGSKGVVLSPTPPNRFRFAVVTAPSEAREEIFNDSLWGALQQSLVEYHRLHPEYSFETYTIRVSGPYQPEYLRLQNDLRCGLLAGVIIPRLLDAALLNGLRGYPVVVHDRRADATYGFRYFYDWSSMTAMAIEQLKRRGASRIAVIMLATSSRRVADSVERAVFSSSGTISHPEWIQGVFFRDAETPWGAHLVRLLFRNRGDCPDGLVVLNENLLGQVVGQLDAMSLVLGRDVHLVSHCNVPATGRHMRNVDYVSFNALKLLERSIRTLEQLRDDSQLPDNIPITPELIPGKKGGKNV